MKKLRWSLLTLALSPSVYAQPGVTEALNTVLTILAGIFSAVFNPSREGIGLGVFIKFLIIITVFALFYELLHGRFSRKGSTAIISAALALAAGLAIPWELALTTGAIFGSIIIAAIILFPFLLLCAASWKASRWAHESKWVYAGLALMWFVYFIILVYFLAHWNVLDKLFAWVFYAVLILAILAPIIMIILIVIAVTSGPEEQRPTILDLYKTWSKSEIRGLARDTAQRLSTTRTELEAAFRASTVDTAHRRIRAAITALNEAKDFARGIAAQASKLLAEAPVADPAERAALTLAGGLLGELNGHVSELAVLLSVNDLAGIRTGIRGPGAGGTPGRNIPARLQNLAQAANAVSHVTQRN